MLRRVLAVLGALLLGPTLSAAAQGAWAATVGDGGESDDDGAYDGRLRASLAGMRGVGDKPAEPPQRFNPRDLVVVIDPNRMEVSVHKVAEDPQ
jgi:hypothetical protein